LKPYFKHAPAAENVILLSLKRLEKKVFGYFEEKHLPSFTDALISKEKINLELLFQETDSVIPGIRPLNYMTF